MSTSTEPRPADGTVDIPPAFVLQNVSKSFGGTAALSDVTLAIGVGEVLGLVGENGAGKSTIIKILAGFYTPDEGSLLVNGREMSLPLGAGVPRQLGMEFVHQDLALIDSLTVVENLRLDYFVAPEHRWHMSLKREIEQARQTLAKYHLDIDPRTELSTLKPLERSLLAIARAVEGIYRSSGSDGPSTGLLVLDEPTVFLPRSETLRLFEVVREVAATGISVLFVAHDLQQIRDVTDRIAVMRNGRMVGARDTASTNESELISLMIGREVLAVTRTASEETADVLVRVNELDGAAVKGVSFVVNTGEVVGVTGLPGSGFDELPYLLYGEIDARGGDLEVKNTRVPLKSMQPWRARDLGVALIPAERLRDGVIASLPVVDNIMMSVMQRFFHGVLNRRAMVRSAAVLMTEFDVRASSPLIEQGSLSGGNQQKALLAKWVQTHPSLLLLHEPTQGVDVGARRQVNTMVRDVAADGCAVICSSSDYDQIVALCDRVIVFADGIIKAELSGAAVNKENLVAQVYGGSQMSEKII